MSAVPTPDVEREAEWNRLALRFERLGAQGLADFCRLRAGRIAARRAVIRPACECDAAGGDDA